MRKRKHKTDYQLIADAYDVSVNAVNRAMERRNKYPNNRLVKAYEKLQATKVATISKMKAVKKVA